MKCISIPLKGICQSFYADDGEGGVIFGILREFSVPGLKADCIYSYRVLICIQCMMNCMTDVKIVTYVRVEICVVMKKRFSTSMFLTTAIRPRMARESVFVCGGCVKLFSRRQGPTGLVMVTVIVTATLIWEAPGRREFPGNEVGS